MPAKPDHLNDFPPGPRTGRESSSWKLWQSDPGDGPRPYASSPESGQCCVYNQTGERFLSADVEVGDFTASSLETRLQTLSPTEGKSLWLVPFRGMSPTSVRMPLDLVYLDRECVVIEAVESFPIFRISASSRPASSVLVLPPQTIASTSTRAGDQLIFRPPTEMKLVLQQLAKINAEGQPSRNAAQVSNQSTGTGFAPNQSHGPRQVLPWKDLARPEPAPDPPEPTISPIEFAPAPLEQAPPDPTAVPDPPDLQQPRPKKKSWLGRLLSAEPDDKRTALRESIPGLTAFFFTGGAPAPHGIRDVSITGMYVFTEERWYPGTVIRITLTDQREPTAERSFTVNAMVMRWGNDGVGLHFIFQDKKNRRRGVLSSEERTMGIADAVTFRQYLATLRGE